jgi:hypothetical protein
VRQAGPALDELALQVRVREPGLARPPIHGLDAHPADQQVGGHVVTDRDHQRCQVAQREGDAGRRQVLQHTGPRHQVVAAQGQGLVEAEEPGVLLTVELAQDEQLDGRRGVEALGGAQPEREAGGEVVTPERHGSAEVALDRLHPSGQARRHRSGRVLSHPLRVGNPVDSRRPSCVKAPVAQGIEQGFPKPCAGVRVSPGAPPLHWPRRVNDPARDLKHQILGGQA